MQLVTMYNKKDYTEHLMLVEVLKDFVEFRKNHNPDEEVTDINCDDCEVTEFCPVWNVNYALEYNTNEPNAWLMCYEAYRRYVEKRYAQQLHIGPSAPTSIRLEKN